MHHREISLFLRINNFIKWKYWISTVLDNVVVQYVIVHYQRSTVDKIRSVNYFAACEDFKMVIFQSPAPLIHSGIFSLSPDLFE